MDLQFENSTGVSTFFESDLEIGLGIFTRHPKPGTVIRKGAIMKKRFHFLTQRLVNQQIRQQ
jgi:hypothetical protein